MVSSVGGSKLKSPIRFLLLCSPRERSSLPPPKKYQEQDCLYPEGEAVYLISGLNSYFMISISFLHKTFYALLRKKLFGGHDHGSGNKIFEFLFGVCAWMQCQICKCQKARLLTNLFI